MTELLKKNENLIAWVFSLSGIPILFLILWLNWPSQAAVPNPAANNTAASAENRALILKTIRLKARISICEKAQRGESQYRSSCTAEEQKRLPEYKAQLQELETKLNKK